MAVGQNCVKIISDKSNSVAMFCESRQMDNFWFKKIINM